MGRDSTLYIRASIEHARKLDAESAFLQQFVEQRLQQLHHVIQLPKNEKSDTLIFFLQRYIEQVPDFIDALVDISKSAGIYSFVERLVVITQDFFKQPLYPADQARAGGLHVLISQAYFAHRLMEEVNDRIMMACGIPLIPMDMTRSNIVVHSILGEDFANQLDSAVHFSIDNLFEDTACVESASFKAYIALHKAKGWSDLLFEWPCLASESAVMVDLEHRPDPAAFH